MSGRENQEIKNVEYSNNELRFETRGVVNFEDKKFGKQSRLQALEKDLKALQWQKLANDAAIKAVLLKNKKLKKKNRRKKSEKLALQVKKESEAHPSISKEALRLQRIVLEEETRMQRKKTQVILKQDVRAHTKCLQHIKEKLRRREEIQKRKFAYKKIMRKANTLRTRLQSTEEHKIEGDLDLVQKARSKVETTVDALHKLAQLEREVAELNLKK
eukprot:snap_masked-scaffold_10-processed-gene-11.22-mRNA-1 protein AED:1.00 eAED:1.00 QI:0/-1/0/0/-1/1/1/0/215